MADGIVGALPADSEILTYADLALALGGSQDSFTGHLLRLIAKADPGNRARLRAGFPKQVAAWEIWMHINLVGFEDAAKHHMTAGDLAAALATVADC